MNPVKPSMTPEKADYMARCFVNGAERHSKSGEIEPITGAWGPRFQQHPWCIQSDEEGWGKELRMAVVAAARRRIMGGKMPSDISIEDMMPPRDLIEHWKRQSERAESAARWRRANPDHPSIRGLSEIDPEGLLRRLGINRPE